MFPKRIARLGIVLVACLGLFFTGAAEGGASPSAMSVIWVTNLNPDGPGSLLAALDQANSDGIPSTIRFAPALSGGTIKPYWRLPALRDDYTTLDGDNNGDHQPDIEISGEDCSECDGIQIASSHNLVRGLAITRFSSAGIRISGHFNRVEYCNVGTDLTGTQNRGNNGSGIEVSNGGSDNVIGPGSIVANNATSGGPMGGIAILDGFHDEAYPDFEGYTPDYSNLFPVLDFPATKGAFTSADGITPVDENGQYFADTFGARFFGELSVRTAGEYTFTVDHPDDMLGVYVDGELIVEAGCMTEWGCNGRSVTAYLNAGEHEIYVAYFAGPGAAAFALEISGPGAAELSYDGQTGLWGEFFQLRIPSERNRITRNSIFENGQLGIELDSLEYGYGSVKFGVNFLDPGDGDMGPNTAINYPVLTSAIATLGRTIVKGNIDTPDPKNITLEFFANPVPWPGSDPSGYGEGQIFIGTARPDRNGKFTATMKSVAPGTLVTATATDALGNTSEFAANIEAKLPH